MSERPPLRKLRSKKFQQSGVALVLTLALLLVAAVIVTAFFSRSGSDAQSSAGYAARVSAENLAELGTSQVISMIIEEAESTASRTIQGSNGPIFLVDRDQADGMVLSAQRHSALQGDDFKNLLRQSISGQQWSTLNLKASDVSTYDPSRRNDSNYRALNGEYWSKPLLTLEDIPDNAVPYWIYVAANGESPSNPDGKNEERVVGRYAFNVYDVGGLLDMNAAGFTSSSRGTLEGRKGSLIYADLPYLASYVGVSFTDSDVAALNRWRYKDFSWDPVDGKPEDSLALLLKTGPLFASLGKYPPGVDLTNLPEAPEDGRIHKNAFFTRADLIRFFANRLDSNDPEMENTKRILPYLTHFTRDINAPTFRWFWEDREKPLANTNSVSVSNTNVEKINPDPWDDSGRSLMPRRFALDQIELLKLDDSGAKPDSRQSNPEAVEKAFGLRWNDSLRCWVYDESKIKVDGGKPRFRTLEEVADAKELPNFFEVLSAAISCGSLGQQLAGVTPAMMPDIDPENMTGTGFDTDPAWGRAPNNRPHAFGLDDSCVAYHVARIGAAIIDQWDADSFPTTIEVHGRTIFGVEDLPYLHGFKRLNYYGALSTARSVANVGTVLEGGTFLHPQVWNPHAPPEQEPDIEKPKNFRVVPYTQTMMSENLPSDQLGGNPAVNQPSFAYGTDFGRPNIWPSQHDSANGGFDYTNPYVVARYPNAGALGNLDQYNSANGANPLLDQQTDWIQFNDNSGDDTREPVLIWEASGNGRDRKISAVTSGTGTTRAPWPIHPSLNRSATSNPTPRVGFRVGKYYVNAAPNGNTTGAPWAQVDLLRYRGWAEYVAQVNFALQYEAPDGRWVTYDIMYDVVDLYTPRSTIQNASSHIGPAGQDQVWRVMGRDHDGTYRVDPRVERFGPQSQFYRVSSGDEGSINTKMTYFPPNSTGWSDTGTVGNVNNPRGFLFRTQVGGDDWRFMAYNQTPRANGTTLSRMDNLYSLWPNVTFSYTFNTFVNIASNTGRTARDGTTYRDPDGIMRYGSVGLANFTNNNQNPLSPIQNTSNPENASARPVVLNRPFQSVAEMGYACRDLPWKSLDFWNANSGDAVLLDFFCLHNVDNDPYEDPNATQLTAGVLNLNSADPAVLASMLVGTSSSVDGEPGESAPISEGEAEAIAEAITEWIKAEGGPFLSRAELVGRPVSRTEYESPLSGRYSSNARSTTNSENGSSNRIKSALGNDFEYDSRRTSLMRSLVDAVGVRTWNLMIDITAQSGKIKPGGDFEDFAVDGQARYWAFVAIDRFTGKVVDQRIERAD